MGLTSKHSTPVRPVKEKPARSADSTVRFKQRLDQVAADTEALLDRLLASKPIAGELLRPTRLLDAMRYSSLGGGKRIRPFLVVETAKLFGVSRKRALMVGAALECVHCYSLVHDDLPAMDDDALRRGRPTAHKAFDEATAILSGDGLLTFAFDVLSRPQTHPNTNIRIKLTSALARAAGIGGMTGGQMLDLAAESRFTNGRRRRLDVDDVKILQAMKTGALLKFACASGAVLAQAPRKSHTALERYGSAVGEAFQIADDLLDIQGDAATVGKATGKDAAAHKATFLSLLGVEGARQRLKALIAEAEKAIAPFGKDGVILKAAAHFIADRQS